ncbi:lysophospholipid acyltransferase family protein [Novosphingobium sp.]|uniref:lysophospholipid acyltransferase family protein n=1 Tax=Novosphingobium sp. TaxID=1874826 RepID=UPI00333E6F4A
MTTPDRPAGLAGLLRNIAFYTLFYGGSVPLLMINIVTLLLPAGVLFVMVRVWCGWHWWCCRHVLGIRVVVEGQVPDYPALFAMRHESFFEAIDLPILLHNPVVFAKQELFAIPLWGALGRRYGLVTVDRHAGARALKAMFAAARAHSRGAQRARPLVIFPEGTRVPHGTAAPLQAGFAGLYKIMGLPVVPVAVDSGPLYHRWWKRPGVITYRFGAEIPAGLPRHAIETAVHDAINALNS